MGRSVVTPSEQVVGAGTMYDLASLTKPLVTGTLSALLASRGALDLEAPAERYLPELSGRWVGRASLLDLLAHRSGLPSWLPLYLSASDREGYLEEIGSLPADYRPGTRVVYSCLGYILLAAHPGKGRGRPPGRSGRRGDLLPAGASGHSLPSPPGSALPHRGHGGGERAGEGDGRGSREGFSGLQARDDLGGVPRPERLESGGRERQRRVVLHRSGPSPPGAGVPGSGDAAFSTRTARTCSGAT